MSTDVAHLFRLAIAGLDASLSVVRVRGEERIHAPFRFEVAFRAHESDGARLSLSAADLVAQEATLSFVIGAGGEERSVEGIVHEVSEEHGVFEVVLVARLALLAEAVDHRVYVDKDVLAIVEDVLGAHGLTLEKRFDRSLSPRPQCVQAFETDLDFICRLAAEEGASLFLPWDDGRTVIIADSPSAHDDLPAGEAIPVTDRGGLVADEGVHHTALRHRLTSTQVSLRDYDFTRPAVDQAAAADAGSKARERYEYPGFYEDPEVGATLATLRLDAYRARARVLTGKTAARRLVPGYVLTLESADEARSGRFLVLEVTHEAAERAGAAGRTSYEASFVAIPADTVFRAPRPRAVRMGGIQTATVTGPSGAEIHTETHGRTKVHLRWDRRATMDDASSAWARVAQPPTSGGFFLPRAGWEVLLSFHERSADDVLVVGRLYNGTAVPPSSLPGKKVVSAFGTLTSPGGGSTNGVSMDDAAGAENMAIVASKDLNDRTENNKNIAVTANDTWTIGADATTITGQVYDVTVGGAQSYSVGATREVNVTANKVVNAGSETVMVGGARIFDIGGDHVTSAASVTRLVGAAKAELGIEHVNRAVQGPSTTLVGGTWSVAAATTNNINVSGASTELVGGVKSIKSTSYYANVKGALGETFASRSVTAGGDRQEGFGAAASYRVGASGKLKGSDVTFTATARIVIEAGGVKITITPGSIEVSGDFKSDVAGIDDGKVDYE